MKGEKEMEKKKEKKPIFNKIGPKIERAMESKAGQTTQNVLNGIGTGLSIAGGIMAIGTMIVGMHNKSKKRIEIQKQQSE